MLAGPCSGIRFLLFLASTCHVVAQLCLTLCDPKDDRPPGLPGLQRLPEFAQTHVRGISDAIPSSLLASGDT